MTYKIVRRNKRFVIVDKDEKIIYYPPDFMKNKFNLKDMQNLVDSMNQIGYNIQDVANFESGRKS